MDCATPIAGKETTPSPGALTLCLNCGEILTFNDKLRVERVTEVELFGLDAESKRILLKARRLIIARGPLKEGA